MANKVEDFLSKEEEQEIINAIQRAELNTSGEIRVHIEKTSDGDAINRAIAVFHDLKMNTTKLRNAVLIYVAVQDRTFAIYGDQGINDVVPNHFWDSTKDLMQKHFKAKNFKQGIIDGILESGEQLKAHFPYLENDTNELTNDISKG